MPIASRLGWLRDQLSAGRRAHFSLGEGKDQDNFKLKVALRPQGAGVTSPAVRRALLGQLDAICSFASDCIAVDRGHAHSGGDSVVQVWLRARPAPLPSDRQPAADDPMPDAVEIDSVSSHSSPVVSPTDGLHEPLDIASDAVLQLSMDGTVPASASSPPVVPFAAENAARRMASRLVFPEVAWLNDLPEDRAHRLGGLLLLRHQQRFPGKNVPHMISSELRWQQHRSGLRVGREIDVERWRRYLSSQSLTTAACERALNAAQ